MMGAGAFQFLTERPGMQIFSLRIFAIHKAFNNKYSKSDIKIALDKKPTIKPPTKLPPEYHNYTEVFSVAESDKLSPHEPGKIPDHDLMYKMSTEKLHVLKKYLEDNFRKEFICISDSSTASSVLFAKKPGGGFRFCVDYQKLNDITVKDRYPIPLIQGKLNRWSQACWFSKLDVIATFNKMRI